jgi:3-deoxy-7-phosphoheptulonate synthase
MLVVMQAHASEEQVRAVCQKIEALGYRAHSIPGAERTAIGITGNKGEVEAGTLEEMSGVQEVIRVTKPYKLVSRDIKPENTVVRFAGSDATIGGPGLAIMAGPCAIESREQAFAVAERVSAGRCAVLSGRGLQAEDFSVFVSGFRRRRFTDHG